MFLRRDGRDLSETRSDELAGKVDDGRTEFAKDELGELHVELGDLDEPRLEEGDGDRDIELAFILGVEEPSRNFLRDFGRDGAETIEEEDVGVSPKSARAAVHELNDLLRATEDRLVSGSRSRCNEGDLLDDASDVGFLRNSGEGGSRLVGDSLLEFADKSLHSCEHGISTHNTCEEDRTGKDSVQQTSP